MPKKASTIKDVARYAGVSTATVSRTLNAPNSVSEATKKLVLEAASRTGYQMNHAARNLRKQQTGMIAVFVPDLANPFFSHILAGIEAEAARAEKSVFLVNTYDPHTDTTEALRLYLSTTRADGIIVLDGSLPKRLLEQSVETVTSPPIVFGCEWVPDGKHPSVRADNRAGAQLAIDHLLSLGHTKIGHITGPMWNVLSVERLAGTKTALQQHGLHLPDQWTIEGDFSLDCGAKAARQFLALDARPTAMFCACDMTAIGFMSELSQNGISTPRDVSVIGFDDIDIASRFIPPLTTIHQPRNRIGSHAVRLLMDAIKGETPPAAPIVLPVGLVARQSTRRLT